MLQDYLSIPSLLSQNASSNADEAYAEPHCYEQAIAYPESQQQKHDLQQHRSTETSSSAPTTAITAMAHGFRPLDLLEPYRGWKLLGSAVTAESRDRLSIGRPASWRAACNGTQVVWHALKAQVDGACWL